MLRQQNADIRTRTLDTIAPTHHRVSSFEGINTMTDAGVLSQLAREGFGMCPRSKILSRLAKLGLFTSQSHGIAHIKPFC